MLPFFIKESLTKKALASYVIILVLALSLLPLQQLKAQTTSRTKSYETLDAFGTKSYRDVYYDFYDNGTVGVSDQYGNLLVFDFNPVNIAYTKYSNSTCVWYTVTGQRIGSATITLSIYFDFVKLANATKMTIKGTSNRAYALSIQLKNANYYNLLQRRIYTIAPNGDPINAIYFDWSESNTYFIFNNATKVLTLNIPASSFNIDPSTVGTSTTTEAVSSIWNKRIFYCPPASLFLATYTDGTNYVGQTSSDGVTWNAKFTIKSSITISRYISMYYDVVNDYLVYSTATESSGADIFYRRGRLYPNGSLIWSAVEQTAVAIAGGKNARRSNIGVSSGGYAYITYTYYDTTYLPYIVKNANNDGTWSTEAGFPSQLNSTSSDKWCTSVAPLSSNVMVITTCADSQNLSICHYDGSFGAWKISKYDSNVGDHALSTDAVYDIAYYSYSAHVTSSSKQWYLEKYDYDTDSILYQTSAGSSSTQAYPACSADFTNSQIYLFWIASNIMKYRIYYESNSSWGTTLTLGSDVSMSSSKMNVFQSRLGNYIGAEWLNGTGSPYQVRFGLITISTGAQSYTDIVSLPIQFTFINLVHSTMINILTLPIQFTYSALPYATLRELSNLNIKFTFTAFSIAQFVNSVALLISIIWTSGVNTLTTVLGQLNIQFTFNVVTSVLNIVTEIVTLLIKFTYIVINYAGLFPQFYTEIVHLPIHFYILALLSPLSMDIIVFLLLELLPVILLALRYLTKIPILSIVAMLESIIFNAFLLATDTRLIVNTYYAENVGQWQSYTLAIPLQPWFSMIMILTYIFICLIDFIRLEA